MRMRFFLPQPVATFAYAVYRGGHAVLRNPLFRACFDRPGAIDALVRDKTAYHFEEPIPHWAIRHRFSLCGEEYALLICLPDEASRSGEQSPEAAMQAVADLFRVVLAFTDKANTTHAAVSVRTLFREVCTIVRKRVSATLAVQGEDSVSEAAVASLDREGFMLTLGFLLPCLAAGNGRIYAGLQEEPEGEVAMVLEGAGEVSNAFHRSLAAAVGAACGFEVRFTPKGASFLLHKTAADSRLLLAADPTVDLACVDIGMLLCEQAEEDV